VAGFHEIDLASDRTEIRILICKVRFAVLPEGPPLLRHSAEVLVITGSGNPKARCPILEDGN
jgi:hypothetical protein